MTSLHSRHIKPLIWRASMEITGALKTMKAAAVTSNYAAS
jgi:hypothetical protein